MTLEQLRDIAGLLGRQYDVKRLDAFGSTAKGTAGPSSDVDLLVEFNSPDRDRTGVQPRREQGHFRSSIPPSPPAFAGAGSTLSLQGRGDRKANPLL